LLTAATAVQIAIAIILFTRPSRDDVESADRARPATVSAPSGDEQAPPPAEALPFAARKEGFYRRDAAGSRPHAGAKLRGSPSTKGDRPAPRTVPSPPPPPPPAATTAARVNPPPPPLSVTATAAGGPPPTVARSPGGGGDDDDDDDEEEEDDEDEGEDGDDDEDGDDGGDDDDD
jgi:hypothetical protein